jgi:ppGpp synthetase/RelA/SpoT-type nucleotidyltranferase
MQGRQVTKTQIDRLGERLRKGSVSEEDVRLLDNYRRSYADAYETVVGSIRKILVLEPTGRPAKSTISISEKLRRESIRLTQIQDIAGCRLIGSDITEQERVVESLRRLFDDLTIVDRRERPSYGYRAVHLIVTCCGKLVEVQVRTSLQHLWAELSEKLSDVMDPSIKYGGGEERTRLLLEGNSALIAGYESGEKRLVQLLAHTANLNDISDDLRQQIAELREDQARAKDVLAEHLGSLIARVQGWRGK